MRAGTEAGRELPGQGGLRQGSAAGGCPRRGVLGGRHTHTHTCQRHTHTHPPTPPHSPAPWSRQPKSAPVGPPAPVGARAPAGLGVWGGQSARHRGQAALPGDRPGVPGGGWRHKVVQSYSPGVRGHGGRSALLFDFISFSGWFFFFPPSRCPSCLHFFSLRKRFLLAKLAPEAAGTRHLGSLTSEPPEAPPQPRGLGPPKQSLFQPRKPFPNCFGSAALG